jgi:hypothetical protein
VSRRFRQIGVISSLIEAIMAGMEGFTAYSHGSHAVHLAWWLASVLSVSAAAVQWTLARRHNRHT